MEVDVDALDEAPTGWVRIDMIASQAGERARVPIGCYRLALDEATPMGGGFECSLNGASVLSAASETVPLGTYVLGGSDACAWAAGQLSALCPAPVTATASAALPSTIVFGDSDTVLDAAWQVLDAVGCVLRVAGDGSATVEAAPTQPAASITASEPHGVSDVSIGDGEVTYTREFDPSIGLFDRVAFGLPSLGLDGVRVVAAQSLTAGRGMEVKETTKDGLWLR